MISKNDQKNLMMLARVTLEEFVKRGQLPSVESLGIPLSTVLQEPCGAFVTLYLIQGTEKMLRGCIGTIRPVQPLYQAIIQNTVAAAARDPRFSRVREEELSDIALEINILTLPKKIASYEQIQLGRDGIIFHLGNAQSVFLPSVPLTFHWDLRQTLSQLALKAGFPATAWEAAEAWFEIFESEMMQEKN
ncbi:MAG: AmmeMemoRadiSam system protein A [Verrucomicrobia bacterium]|nr:AmmeMemoRadiSam system protein A [Verrucomicrobiota bacterium]